jgi:hypothetical protein
MLSLYHKVTNGRACTVKKELQLQQCCAVNRGPLRTVHSATGARVEHPLRYLEEPSFMVLFQTAAIHGSSTLCKCSLNPDRTRIPRMPRITDLSRLRTMGIRLSTCTTKTEPILGWPRTRQQGAPSLGTRPTQAGFNHSLDSVACIIVTPWQHKRVILHTSRKPQGSHQKRPTVVTSKPANGEWPRTRLFYSAASCGGKSVFVRQLRGPHLSTWP